MPPKKLYVPGDELDIQEMEPAHGASITLLHNDDDIAPTPETDETEKHLSLKERLAPIGKRLPRFSDPNQKRAFNNILRFLALMLVFTLLARGTAGATMTRVKAAAPTRGEVTEAVSASGTVEAASSVPVTVPEGLTLKQMLVAPGQKVAAGDPIARFDQEEILDKLEREQISLEKLRQNLRQLERGEPYDSSALITAQNGLSWAQQDLDAQRQAGNDAIAAANRALDSARAEQTAARQALDSLPSDATAEERAAAQSRMEAADLAVRNAEAAVQDAAKEAERSNQSREREVERARLGLETAKTDDEKKRQDAADQKAKDAIEARTLRLDIQKQEKLIESYSAFSGDGQLNSPAAGTVLAVAPEGEASTAKPVVMLTNNEGGWRAWAMLPQSEAQKLKSGAPAEIESQAGFYNSQKTYGASLISLGEPDENKMVKALFSLPEGEWSYGQSVQVSVVKSRESYDTVVPLTALHEEQGSYFVYVMYQQSGVLGIENMVRKVPVTLLAKGKDTAAISGAMSAEDKVISWSSKPISEGDKVRVKET